MSRKLEQKPVQGLPIAGVEWCEKLFLQALRDRADLDELAPSLSREADHVAPPVARVPLTLDQPSLLE
jgi:hypothetical protein